MRIPTFRENFNKKNCFEGSPNSEFWADIRQAKPDREKPNFNWNEHTAAQ